MLARSADPDGLEPPLSAMRSFISNVHLNITLLSHFLDEHSR